MGRVDGKSLAYALQLANVFQDRQDLFQLSGIDFNFGAELMDVEERRQMLKLAVTRLSANNGKLAREYGGNFS